MVRYFIELAYNGSRYHGWQTSREHRPCRKKSTGPSVLCYARTYTSSAPVERIRVYTLHFSSLISISNVNFRSRQQVVYKLNGLLDKDIAIYKIYRVPMDKHARFSAISRTYKYYIDKTKDPFTIHLPGKLIPCRIFRQ